MIGGQGHWRRRLMGIFPHGRQQTFIQQQPHRLDPRTHAQLAAGAGHLGVDGLRRLARQTRDGLAAMMRGDIGHHLALPFGQEARQRTVLRSLQRHGATLAGGSHRVHAAHDASAPPLRAWKFRRLRPPDARLASPSSVRLGRAAKRPALAPQVEIRLTTDQGQA